jgi:hypothetical protein
MVGQEKLTIMIDLKKGSGDDLEQVQIKLIQGEPLANKKLTIF